MTLEWKVRSYRSENGRKIMSEDRRSLENKDFLQISQLVLHSTRLSLDAVRVRTLFFCPGRVLAPEVASKVSTPSKSKGALQNENLQRSHFRFSVEA